MSHSEEDKPVIDLDTPFNSKPLTLENNIHAAEFKQVTDRLANILSDLPPTPKLEPDGELPEAERSLLQVHDAQFIHGSRGSGKTNFLRTLRYVLSSRDGNATSAESRWKELRVLEPLDPSLVASGEHFLTTVVSALLREVQRESKNGRKKPERLEEVSTALTGLSRGLRVLRGGNGILPASEQDDQTVSRELLRGAMSGTRLHEHFHCLVIACANFLNVKAFLLLIDDADTAFSMTWEVLETLRRYLSSRRFQVVLAGDRELFELAVLQAQYGQLDKLRSWLNEGKGVTGRPERKRPEDVDLHVEQLKRQYLLKLLERNARVNLPSLGDLFFLQPGKPEPKELSVTWTKVSETKRMVLTWRMTDLLFPLHMIFFGLGIGAPAELSRDVRRWPPARLLSENLRSAHSLLRFAADFPNSSTEWTSRTGDEARSLQRLAEIFASELDRVALERTLPIELARGERYGLLGEWLLRQSLNRMGIGGLDVSLLEGAESIEDLRTALLVAVAGLHQAARRCPGEVFRALGRAWLPVNLFEHEWSEEEAAEGEMVDFVQKVHQLSQFLRLPLAEPAWKTAARVAAKQVRLSRARDIGQLRITKKMSGDQRSKVAYHFFKLDDPEFLRTPFWRCLKESPKDFGAAAVGIFWIPPHQGIHWRFGLEVATVVQWFSLSFERYASMYRYLDFWKGICALGDLLHEGALVLDAKVAASGASGGSQASLATDQPLRDCLARILGAEEDESVNVLGEDPPILREDEDESAPDEGERDDSERDVTGSALAKAMLVWAKVWALEGADNSSESQQSVSLPPWVMTRVASRLESNLKAIFELEASRFSFGEALERWSCLLLHHLLIEEAIFRDLPVAPTLKVGQLVSTLEPFDSNLKKVEFRYNHLPFFGIWASCPILLACMRAERRKLILERLSLPPELSGEAGALSCFKSPKNELMVEYSPYTKQLGNLSGFRPARPVGMPMDIHTALCGLFVVPEKHLQKVPDALEKRLEAWSGIHNATYWNNEKNTAPTQGPARENAARKRSSQGGNDNTKDGSAASAALLSPTASDGSSPSSET